VTLSPTLLGGGGNPAALLGTGVGDEVPLMEVEAS
jgi:hypothetical protein